ncbi:FAD-binding protein [Actinoplanes sp. NPDC049802]|uniref:FAD-binding protein n=1 Tax=Actinoplanes sp. NPDC049802 TaxID=3154742 RepID=UPI00340A2D13
MNLRHRLRIGALVTHDAADVAPHAEAAGYDLIAATGPDAWTTLSWIAGRTTGIRLLAAGLTVPGHNAAGLAALGHDPAGLAGLAALGHDPAGLAGLAALGHDPAGLAALGQDPAMLARSAASLDLLSGGRLEIALTGEPGVLTEAIEIIRGLHDTARPGPLRHPGPRFRIPGTQRGPEPAHRIPVAIMGPLSDGLIAVADGWLATTPGELRDHGKALDDAAVAAGREPGEIRRLLVVPPDLGQGDLLELVMEHGVDTLLIPVVEAADLGRFAPGELRDAVARLRPHPVPAVFKPASVRAKRHPGIKYDAIPGSLAETAIEPGDPGYRRVRSTYLRGGAPGLVLRPRTVTEVADALAFARAHPHLPFGVRSRGHGISGRSTNDGGLVVSVAALDGIEILDESRRLVRIGPGARWTDVAQALAPYGWAITSGDYGGVGVGGLATAGGIGWLAREHGLTIDKLVAAEMVLADGSTVRVSATENPDLFWAVRGAGANFGIVTSFEFEADEVGDVGFARFAVGADDPAALLVRWGRAIEEAPRDLSGQLILGRPRRGQPNIAQLVAVVDAGDPRTVVDRLQPIAGVGPLYDQNVVLTPYAGIMANASPADHDGHGEPVSRSALVEHLTPEFAEAAARLLDSGAIHWFQIRTVGGAVADVPADATAYAHRSANFSIVVMGADERRLDAAWAGLRDHFDGLYLNFETGRGAAYLNDAFPPATLARLRELKRRYDPGNLFRDNFNIEPGGTR